METLTKKPGIPELYTFEETMEMLKIKDRSTLVNLMNYEQIGYTKIGRTYRFSIVQINKFLNDNTVTR